MPSLPGEVPAAMPGMAELFLALVPVAWWRQHLAGKPCQQGAQFSEGLVALPLWVRLSWPAAPAP